MCNDCQIVSFSLSPEEYGQVLAAMQRAGFADESAFLRYIMLQAVDAELSAW